MRSRSLRDSGGTVSPAELDELTGRVPDGVRPPAWVEERTRSRRIG